jgi:hypothetical protein
MCMPSTPAEAAPACLTRDILADGGGGDACFVHIVCASHPSRTGEPTNGDTSHLINTPGCTGDGWMNPTAIQVLQDPTIYLSENSNSLVLFPAARGPT